MVLAVAGQVRAAAQAGRPGLAVLERIAGFDEDRSARNLGQRGPAGNDLGFEAVCSRCPVVQVQVAGNGLRRGAQRHGEAFAQGGLARAGPGDAGTDFARDKDAVRKTDRSARRRCPDRRGLGGTIDLPGTKGATGGQSDTILAKLDSLTKSVTQMEAAQSRMDNLCSGRRRREKFEDVDDLVDIFDSIFKLEFCSMFRVIYITIVRQ